MPDLKDLSKLVKEKIDASGIKEKVQSVTEKDLSKLVKEKIDASGIKERVQSVTEKIKTSTVLTRDKSVLAFSKTCTRKYIEIGGKVTVTLKLQSRYEKGVLDCIVTDEIPPQFELISEMPSMIYQLSTREEKEYQYEIRATVGGHFSTRAMCEIENKFSLDDIPSNDMEIYVSPLSIQMKAQEMAQGQWKEQEFVFKNLSKENMTSITVSLKTASKFALDKAPTYNKLLTPNQSVVIPLLLKTQESGSVSLDLDIVCTDENGEKYITEKNFVVPVIEADKTVAKVDIGTIGEVVASGATQIKESIIQRSTIGEAETKDEPLEESKTVEVSGSIVQRTEISRGTDEPEVGRTCPNCSKELQEGWMTCPFCGCKLELKCPNCDHSVEEGWQVCPFCSEKLK